MPRSAGRFNPSLNTTRLKNAGSRQMRFLLPSAPIGHRVLESTAAFHSEYGTQSEVARSCRKAIVLSRFAGPAA